MLDSAIPTDLQAAVNRELERGETVVWSGMPRPAYFTPAATGAFLFGIPWTAFAVFWIGAASSFGPGNFGPHSGMFSLFPLLGVPFVLIGIGMLTAPIWTFLNSLKTVYVITNRRAITMDGGWSTTVRSYPSEKLNNTYRRERPDGSGDIIIFRREWRNRDGDPRSEELGFFRINDAKMVESHLRSLAKQSAQPART